METARYNTHNAVRASPAGVSGFSSESFWASHFGRKMQIEFEFKVDEIAYKGLAERSDLPWGKALVVQTSDDKGRLRDSVCFINHPEFDEFHDVQRKTTEELLILAIDILRCGQHETELEIARREGLTLYIRLNGRKNENA